VDSGGITPSIPKTWHYMEVSSQLHSWIIYLQAYDQFTYGYKAGSAQEQIAAKSMKKFQFPNHPA